MKRRIAALSIIVILTVCYTLSVSAGGSFDIMRRSSVVYVDGFLEESDWAGVINIPANNLQVGNTWNNDARMGLLWDDTYLYLGVIVKDDILNAINGLTSIYGDDCIEIFIDGDNHKGDSYNEFDRQYLIRWNSANLRGGDLATGSGNPDITGVKFGVKTTEDGYTVETAIPWTSIGISAAENIIIGFDINVDDNDTGIRDAIAAAFGTSNNYWDTREFANARLSPAMVAGGSALNLQYKAGQR